MSRNIVFLICSLFFLSLRIYALDKSSYTFGKTAVDNNGNIGEIVGPVSSSGKVAFKYKIQHGFHKGSWNTKQVDITNLALGSCDYDKCCYFDYCIGDKVIDDRDFEGKIIGINPIRNSAAVHFPNGRYRSFIKNVYLVNLSIISPKCNQ